MKILFLYKVVEIRTGRAYFGIHESEDILFATPRCSLEDVSSYEHAIEPLPYILQQKIRAYGKSQFTIEALASGTRSQLEKQKRICIEQAGWDNVYNGIPMHEQDDMHKAAWKAKQRNNLKGNTNRQKYCPSCKQRIYRKYGRKIHHCPLLKNNNLTLADIESTEILQ